MSDFFADLEAQLVAAHPRRGRARVRAAAPGVLGVLGVVGAGAALALSLGGPAEHNAATRPTTTDAVPTTPVPVPAHPAAVAILNGTTRAGLARAVAERLGELGLTIGVINDTPAPNVQRTYVLYKPGARATALSVAARLRAASVRPMRAGDPPVPGPTRLVVVVLGADTVVPPPLKLVSTREMAGFDGASGTISIVAVAARATVEVHGAGLPARSLAVWLDPPGKPSRFAGYTPIPRGGRVTFRMALPSWAGRHPRLFVLGGNSSAPGRLLLRATVP